MTDDAILSLIKRCEYVKYCESFANSIDMPRIDLNLTSDCLNAFRWILDERKSISNNLPKATFVTRDTHANVLRTWFERDLTKEEIKAIYEKLK